ncbi:MAG: xylulokinase [Clostridia bacterium]|nr:xylulokinase [Clostridia bacterium]
MSKKYMLGCDVGTSGTKTVLFSVDGTPITSATVEYPLYQPQNGYAEQDPADWVNATMETIAAVIRQSGVAPADIVSVGLSGQMHGLVMLDEFNQVLRPSIIWCDQRTQAECDEMTRILGRDKLIAITANPAITGFTASKVLWVKNHEPEIYAKVKKIMLPKDYVRFALTGAFVSDYSDASGMQLLDVPNRVWSKEVCDALGIDMSWLCDLCESSDVSGRITPEAASRTGLLVGTPVAGSAGDQAASAVGSGIVRSGVLSATIGTSGVVFAHTDRPVIDPLGRVHTLCHALKDSWHIMGVTQGAGLSLKWFRDTFCKEEMAVADSLGVDPYVIMDKEAALSPIGADGLFFLPYFMGERTPHLDADCRGVFFGLTASHGKRDMLRSVMEGVGYSLTDCYAIIREMGFEGKEVRAAGGGGRSRLWRQMLCDMFDCPVTTTNSSEAGALGAALLGAVAAGIYPDVPTACDATIRTNPALSPDASTADYYKAAHPLYQHLYTSLKGDYKALAALRQQKGM